MNNNCLTTQEFTAKQWQEAKGPHPKVTCECGLKIPLRFMYKCLYCKIYLCEQCAEIHFGQTIKEYKMAQSEKNTPTQ